MKEIDKDIQRLKKEGKNKEADFLEKSKHQIDYCWQINHLWLFMWKKHRNVFWVVIVLLILFAMLGFV